MSTSCRNINTFLRLCRISLGFEWSRGKLCVVRANVVANTKLFCVNVQWPAPNYKYNRPLLGKLLVDSQLASFVRWILDTYTQVGRCAHASHTLD